MSEADATNRRTAQDDTTKAGGGAGTSTPAYQQDDVRYTDRSLNSTDRRTGLRTTDDHYSWRQVAAQCHVKPGR